MKRKLIGIGAPLLFAGFIAGTSFAGQRERMQAVGVQTQDEDNAPGEEWRAALSTILETDEEYTAAAARLEAFTGNDEEQHAFLEADLDEIYYELARSVYEDHLGAWEGDDDEFIALLRGDSEQIKLIKACTSQAKIACGAGNVKSVETTGDGGCKIACFEKVAPVTP